MGVNTVFATDNGSMGDLSANLETQNTVSDISAINPSYDVTNDNALKKDTSTDNITQKNTNKYNNINNKQKQEETNNTIKTTTNTINTNTKTTGTGNFEELEKAINDTNRGETLNLTGNYTRNGEEYLTGITINRTITINGDGFTIDGMNNGRIFQINTDGNLTLNNMTLTKGTTTNTDCGAIYNNGGTLTINNCTLTNNTANSLGGAIYNTGGTINITNSILTHNNATGRGSGGDGGAIYNTGNGVLCVVGSVFLNNTAGSGSAVYKLYGGVVLDGNWWGINDPTSSWGNLLSGIGTPGSYVVMDFINSSKYDRVSVDMFVCSYLNGTKIQVDLPLRTVQFSTEINNGTFNLNSTNFTGNATTKYTGNTGILKANIDNENLKYKLYNPDSFTHLEDLINSTLNNSILKLEGNFTRDNNETGYTDGIVINKTITIDGNGFTINGTSLNSTTGRIFQLDTAGNLTLNNLTLTGGIHEKGGVIDTGNGSLMILNSILYNNSAIGTGSIDGGGVIHSNNSGNVIIINSTLYNNTATTDGGVICMWNDCNVTIINSDLYDNHATDFGGVIGTWDGCIITITDSNLYENYAGYGGTIVMDDDCSINSINNTFYNNKAYDDGAIYSANSNITCINSSLHNNTGNNTKGGAIYNTGN